MIKSHVKFWGSGQDAYGMPVPYHSYLIVASPWQTNGGVASVVPITIDAPLARRHFPVLSGGERAAFDAALTALNVQPENAGLNCASHEG